MPLVGHFCVFRNTLLFLFSFQRKNKGIIWIAVTCKSHNMLRFHTMWSFTISSCIFVRYVCIWVYSPHITVQTNHERVTSIRWSHQLFMIMVWGHFQYLIKCHISKIRSLSVKIILSICNLVGDSSKALLRHLPNFRAIGKQNIDLPLSRLCVSSCGDTMYQSILKVVVGGMFHHGLSIVSFPYQSVFPDTDFKRNR